MSWGPDVGRPDDSRRALASAASFFLPLVAVFAVAPRYVPEVDWDRDELRCAVSSSGLGTTVGLAFVTLMALTFWAGLGRSPRRPRQAAPVAALVVLTFSVCSGALVVGWPGRRTWVAPTTALTLDGATYRPGGQAETFLLLRDVETQGDVWTLAIVAASRGEEYERARVLRPRGARSAAIHSAPDGTILHVAQDGSVRVAWNPRVPRASLAGAGLPAEQRALPADATSPFVLLDDDDVGDSEDLAALLTAVHDHRTASWGTAQWVPREDFLLHGLDSPNPWVRDAARQIVEAGGKDLYPEATERL